MSKVTRSYIPHQVEFRGHLIARNVMGMRGGAIRMRGIGKVMEMKTIFVWKNLRGSLLGM